MVDFWFMISVLCGVEDVGTTVSLTTMAEGYRCCLLPADWPGSPELQTRIRDVYHLQGDIYLQWLAAANESPSGRFHNLPKQQQQLRTKFSYTHESPWGCISHSTASTTKTCEVWDQWHPLGSLSSFTNLPKTEERWVLSSMTQWCDLL